jgi:hypothetical protein
MCGEAGLQTTAPADLAARAEADGIIPVAEFCVNVQMLNFAPFNRLRENPQKADCRGVPCSGLSRQIIWGEAMGGSVCNMKMTLASFFLRHKQDRIYSYISSNCSGETI